MILTLNPRQASAYISQKDYFAAIGSHFSKADAAIIGPELERLSRQGDSSALAIVNAARPSGSPLHRYFEWEDPIAAELWRKQQANHMAAAIVVKVVADDGQEAKIRAFPAVTRRITLEADSPRTEERHYVPIDDVAKDREMAEQVIDEARTYLRTWQSKYRAYCYILPGFGERFHQVSEAIDSAISAER